MTTKRTRFDRRKKPPALVMASEFNPPEQPIYVANPVPLHRDPTAPWRLPRPKSAHLLYRLAVAEADAARELDEAFDACWAAMMERAANDNDRLTPPDL